MNPLAPLLRVVRRRLRSERGFTITELMIAQGLILVSLLSLAYTSTVGFQDIAVARRRASANGIANRVMEQVRSLPYDTVAAGLRTSDLAGDPVTGGTCPAGLSSPCMDVDLDTTDEHFETIVHSASGVSPEPLVPHIAQATVGPTTYTRAVYITRYRGDIPNDNPDAGVVEVPGAYRLTVVVTWPQVEGETEQGRRVQVQSVVYSPGSSSVHPFAAPRQPFLYGSAQVPVGVIELGRTPASTTFILPSDTQPGAPPPPDPPEGLRTISTFERARIWTVNASATAQSEQISTATSRALTSGIELKTTTSAPQVAGQQVVTTSADNDPGQPGQENPPLQSLVGATSPSQFALTGSNTNEVAVTAAAQDLISSRSVMNAGTANPCSSQVDNRACAFATAQQVNSNEIRLRVRGNGVDSGTAVLAVTSGTSGTDSTALVHRDAEPGLDGSMGAEVRRVVGNLRLGGLTTAFTSGALPSGWSNDLGVISIQGYNGTARAYSGTASSALPLDAAVTSGTVRYWNGTGYTQLDLRTSQSGTEPLTFEVPAFSHASSVSGKTVRVEWRGFFQAGGVHTESVGTTTNRTVANAQLLPPLLGSLRYRILVGTPGEAEFRQVDVTVSIDLGVQDASTSYKSSAAA